MNNIATIYIHIPFCLAKCQYCSFVSYPHGGHDLDAYLAALIKDMTTMTAHPWAEERIFTSLFIGGGTPTVYDADPLAGLIEQCLRLFRFIAEPEVTVETNPDAISPAKLQTLRKAGVNRISIGIQSFNDNLLKTLGRTHSAATGRQAVTHARQAGFDNVSLDLMYGLPGQTMTDWLETLDITLHLEPNHLSMYELTVEPGTPLDKDIQAGKLLLPDEETALDMANTAYERLAAAGYERYEIANFARPGKRCRHNINYWQNGSYLGLGAGAVSCFSGLRVKNVTDPVAYAGMIKNGQLPFLEAEALSHDASFRETVIMGLRMINGISIEHLQNRFGFSPESYYGKTLTELLENNLIEIVDGHLLVSGKGLPVANQILSRLV